MHLLSDDSGWIAGADGVLWTQDQGRHWRDITPVDLLRGNIDGVFFLDSGHGWVVASNTSDPAALTLSSSIDGGANWTTRSVPLAAESGALVTAIDFVDARHGWIMLRLPSSANFSRGLLLHSDDAGETWSQLPAPPVSGAIEFISLQKGWLAGGVAHDRLYVTDDGGYHWRQQLLPPPTSASERSMGTVSLPAFQDTHNATLPVLFNADASTVLQVYTSNDGGATWQTGTSLRLDTDSGHAVTAIVDPDTVIVAAPTLAAVTIIEHGQPRTVRLPAQLAMAADEAVTALDFIDAQHGWVLISGGSCLHGKSECAQYSRLVSIDGDPRGAFEALPRTLSSQTSSGTPVPDQVVISQTKGFDQCAAGTVSQMQAWYTSTPWSWANIYVGGANRGCSQSHLNASWVQSILAQGWLVLPTWVGLQAPGSSCSGCSKLSTNTTTAASQGKSEANAASDTAAALGLTSPTIVYFDMEQYSPSSAAVKAFIGGWVQQMHLRGNQAGVYGGGSNAANDWAPISNPPDAVWIANWNNNPSVFGLSGLPDSLWAHHQRIHQYEGGHNETWGGVTFNIDSNASDGPLADVCTVGGAILTEYNHMGGAGGVLGPCTTNELPSADGVGRYNHFVNGSIYWSPATGAHEIHGAIHVEWQATGWETGPLGYPIADEAGAPDGVGRFNLFQHGAIYWTPSTHAHAVVSNIFALWKIMGSETSCLGYPTSDEYAWTSLRRNDFQHGYITWSQAQGAHSSCSNDRIFADGFELN
ncbi:MAG: glycoside hydrolase domain-containing protein [Dokdonella sp.]